MNVVDCLAIAPYYLTLFVFPDPEILVSNDDDLYNTPDPILVGEEDQEEAGLGDVGRIMQVFRIARIMRYYVYDDKVFNSIPIYLVIKDLQVGPKVGRSPVHRTHSEDQLEGSRPPVHARGYGHVGVRKSGVLH